MSAPYHQAVWIDHTVAHIYSITRAEALETAVIHAPDQGTGNIHHKAGTPGPGHAPIPAAFLKEVGNALRDSEEILIVGPSDARYALKRHLDSHFPVVAAKVVGVEAMTRTGADKIHVLARQFFYRADLMPPSDQ